MKLDRYLVFLPDDGGGVEGWREKFARYGRANGLIVTERPWLIALSANIPIRVADDDAESFIVGTVFRRGGDAPETALQVKAFGSWPGVAGSPHYWGDYVEFFIKGSKASVRRSPFGNLACYFVRTADGVLIASDPLVLRDAGCLRLRPNWNALALQLVAPGIRRRETCLDAVCELSGGDALKAESDFNVVSFWSPWQCVRADPISTDPDSAAENLRHMICNAVAAQTAGYAKSVLLLSGGVDSSIVAAALAQAGRQCAALNMVTQSLGGDERAHARRVADHCGFTLTEVERDVGKVDVTRSLCIDQPYPIEKCFRQATMTAAYDLAGEIGAGTILDGGGGDNIFCSLQSAAPLVDLLRRHAPGYRAAILMRDIATITQASHAAILKQAIDRLLRRPPRYRWQRNLTLLTPLGLNHVAKAVAHPWLDAPRGALPGKAGHIGLVLAALALVQSPSATELVPSRSILLAQPVVEACLAIPTWLWFERGRNRAVARRAFDPLLPAANTWRQTKGAMDSFIVEIFEANRPLLREMLADGQLAKSGLVDRAALLAAIDASGPVRGRTFDWVMDFADIEAWIAAWS